MDKRRTVTAHRYRLCIDYMEIGSEETTRYEIGCACEPVDEDGFKMKVNVKSPVPKAEMPTEVKEIWEEWLADVRADYFQKVADYLN